MKNVKSLILALASFALITTGLVGTAAAQGGFDDGMGGNSCFADSDCLSGQSCVNGACVEGKLCHYYQADNGPTTAVFFEPPGDYVLVVGCDQDTPSNMVCSDVSCRGNYYSFMRPDAPACGQNECYWPEAAEPCAYEAPVEASPDYWIWPESTCGEQAVPFFHDMQVRSGKYRVSLDGAMCGSVYGGGYIARITPCNC